MPQKTDVVETQVARYQLKLGKDFLFHAFPRETNLFVRAIILQHTHLGCTARGEAFENTQSLRSPDSRWVLYAGCQWKIPSTAEWLGPKKSKLVDVLLVCLEANPNRPPPKQTSHDPNWILKNHFVAVRVPLHTQQRDSRSCRLADQLGLVFF